MDRKTTRSALATNLDMLMGLYSLSQKTLSERSGVSQKTISNMLNADQPGIGASTLDKVSDVAAAFGLEGWHLLLPGLPQDISARSSISKLIYDYLGAPADSQRVIAHTADRENRLAAEK